MKTTKKNLNYRPLTYFLINKGEASLRVSKYFADYDSAQRASASVGCTVTNGSWLISRGVPLQIETEKDKPGVVVGVTLNGLKLQLGN
jgi:hypothetical protein